MLKTLIAAAVAAAAVAAAGSASAKAATFVIFKNDTSVTWVRTNQSITNGTWMSSQPAVNPPTGMKSGYFTSPSQEYSSYSSAWQVDPVNGIAASCNFWSYTQMNSFGNMQFYSGSSKSGADSAPVTCSTNTPAFSNRDGSYDFNYGVSGL